MSGRNRGLPHPITSAPHHGLPPMHEPPFGRGLGHMPHPALLEEMREAQFGRGPRPLPPHLALLEEMREAQFWPGPRPLPPHPAIIEERLAAQYQEIQGLLVDNQRLAATHVALKQELAAAQHELQRTAHLGGSMQAEKDIQLRELYEKSMNMEADLRAAEATRAELLEVCADIQKLTAARQELSGQVQAHTQNLARANSELQQVPALKAEIEHIKQELQRARAAIEYEKKGHAENCEQGQAMEKNLIAMAREVEKLRAEISNVEKRAHAAAAVGNPGPGYGGNYGNVDIAYGGNSYPAGYGMSPSGAEGGHQYGPGPGPGPGAWAAYDMQRAHGRR